MYKTHSSKQEIVCWYIIPTTTTTSTGMTWLRDHELDEDELNYILCWLARLTVLTSVLASTLASSLKHGAGLKS